MLQQDSAALVIIDVQGKLATLMDKKDELFVNLTKMVRGALALEIPVLWNEQLPDKLGPTIPELSDLLSNKKPYVKNTFSACGKGEFVDDLKKLGSKQVLLVGIETHVCVYQTALDLLHSGYEVHLVVDAVSSRTAENKRIGIESIKDAGGKLTTVEQALFEMLKVAEGDQFKQVIKIVK